MKIGILKILAGLILFSFIGIKYEPEFAEPSFFLKPKPSLTIEYWSPLGDSDMRLEDLTGARRQQELDYSEFVGDFFDNNEVADTIAFLLIPLMMFLLISGFLHVFGLSVNWLYRARFLAGYFVCFAILILSFMAFWNCGYNGYFMTGLFVVFCTLILVYLSTQYKKKTMLPLILLAFFSSCKEEPNYNPFDDQFNVSVESILVNGCDTISAGCGWLNFQVKSGKLRPYYQVDSGEDFYRVVAKGFEYYVDTIKLKGNAFYSNVKLQDSILNLPFNKIELNSELRRFGYEILSIDSNRINVVNQVKKDTANLRLDVFLLADSSLVGRRIDYYKPKP